MIKAISRVWENIHPERVALFLSKENREMELNQETGKMNIGFMVYIIWTDFCFVEPGNELGIMLFLK